jgi:hypothetical protein
MTPRLTDWRDGATRGTAAPLFFSISGDNGESGSAQHQGSEQNA